MSAITKPTPVLYLDLDGTVRKGYDELGKFVNSAADKGYLFRNCRACLAIIQKNWKAKKLAAYSADAVNYDLVKACIRCKLQKDGSKFARDKTSPDGLTPTCKECRNTRERMLIAEKRTNLLRALNGKEQE
jgi:hypothetical protein